MTAQSSARTCCGKAWGAPSPTGTFAIGFETRVNAPAVQYTIVVDEVANDVTAADHASRHHLVYGGTTLVAVVQDPATPVNVSFEHVGLVEPDGFAVSSSWRRRSARARRSRPPSM